MSSPPAPTALERPFHAGEVAVQQRLGVAARMHDIGRRVVRPYLPEQHRQFYGQLPFIMVGSVDAQQRPWASVLVGETGFISSPDERRLRFAARPVEGDPLAEGLQPGAPLGFLGIELHTRRRNRVNGRVRRVGDGGFDVDVEQTVGNCPQYIQGREMHWVRDPQDLTPRRREPLTALDAPARALIARADTLFVASHAAGGADVSHRGGRAGFVHIEDEHTFLVPDFAGNAMYMTLGNLEINPRAGVLFMDFDSGELLTLTGRAEVVWNAAELPAIAAFQGAERAWRFHVESGWRLSEALPLRWRFRDWSPNSLITGTWDEAAARLQAAQLAQTWRPYRITGIVDESAVIRSFHLQPADGLALPPVQAGQHLPIRLQRAEGEAPLLRQYTISSAPGADHLRLSVKREGRASRHLHERLRVGDLIEAQGPRGQFTLDATERRPAVLIGAGVGITPMLAFAHHVVTEGFRHRRTRPTQLIQVAHDPQVQAFEAELAALAERSDGALHVHTVLSEGSAEPASLAGPFSVEMLKRLLPFDDHEFYLCGPGGFMQATYDGLRALGVRDQRIHAEAFGPAALTRRPDTAATPAREASVVFARTGKASVWKPEHGSLLEFAEGLGLTPPSSCRAGNCGSCATRLQSGRVSYARAPAWQVADGEVLLCCAVPAAADIGEDGGKELVLDL